MIIPTKRRLTRIFTAVALALSVLILSISYFFVYYSMLNETKRHMNEDIQQDFLDQFYRSGLDPFKDMWNEHRFQILNIEGKVIVSTRNSLDFYPLLNPRLLKKAFSGKRGFEERDVLNEPYLISYFPIDGKYIGRAAISLVEVKKYERSFLTLILVTFPGIFLISFFVSRYLVNHAMGQVSDFFTFQETFSSNVTHELRTPLASLKGNIEVTLRKDRKTEEYKEIMSLSLNEVDRIINLLNNLNLLASSKFKPLDLFKDAVNIGKIVDEVARAYTPVLNARNIKFDVRKIMRAICICDEALVRRTIENVVDNAVKYTPEGGSISLDVTENHQKMHITITNTCPAINREDREHIFEPFYRGKNVTACTAEGKGLGLYISRYIMRSHGGDIKLNNTYGNLFSLTISLPMR
jgi:signal transduction histidine kinase